MKSLVTYILKTAIKVTIQNKLYLFLDSYFAKAAICVNIKLIFLGLKCLYTKKDKMY